MEMEISVYLSPSFSALLVRRDISKGEFAHSLSITAQHLSRLIHHKSPVGIKTQKRIRAVFKNRPWEDLFTMENPNEL